MFISRIRANGDRSAYGDFWFSPIAARTTSGAAVSADTALCLSAVFRAVGLVSGHMAMLPLCFYRKGTRERVSHPLLRLLNVRPNRWQNAFEWREMLQGHLELRSNAYNEIVANARGEITDLIPCHPDRVKVEVADNGDRCYRITELNGTTHSVAQGAMWHLRGMSSNGITGLSVVEYARESFGLGLAAQSYGARFFANDAKPSGGWVEFPGQFKDKTAKDVFREKFQAEQSAANRGKLMLLDMGMKYHEVGLTNEDAQFLETRQFQITDVARWFGVPPHKIGDLSKAKRLSSFDFNSVPKLSKAHVTALVEGDSWLEQGANLLLFGPSGVGKTHLLAGIGHGLVERGYRVMFTRTGDLVQRLQAARRDLRLPAELAKLDRFDLLICDDFSYVRRDQAETSVLFELIAERYERKSLAITANQPFSGWENVFAEPAMTLAAVLFSL